MRGLPRSPIVFDTAGLALLVAACFTITTTIGLAAAGVALLVLGFRVEGLGNGGKSARRPE